MKYLLMSFNVFFNIYFRFLDPTVNLAYRVYLHI